MWEEYAGNKLSLWWTQGPQTQERPTAGPGCLQRLFECFLTFRDLFFKATKALKPPLLIPPSPPLVWCAACGLRSGYEAPILHGGGSAFVKIACQGLLAWWMLAALSEFSQGERVGSPVLGRRVEVLLNGGSWVFKSCMRLMHLCTWGLVRLKRLQVNGSTWSLALVHLCASVCWCLSAYLNTWQP